MNYPFSYRIFPLGDSALTLDFGNTINETINKEVLALFHSLKQQPFSGITEIIPTYSSLSICYDVLALKHVVPGKITVYEWMKMKLENFLQTTITAEAEIARQIKIPVCYDEEFGTDINQVAEIKNLSKEEIIQLHTATKYRVYMLGFLPGFPYMGKTDKRIAMPRKDQPEIVKTGSVALAGRQTGIYPMSSPGGWYVIGRTAVKLFDVEKKDVTLLKPGDMVEFYAISKEEYLKQAYES